MDFFNDCKECDHCLGYICEGIEHACIPRVAGSHFAIHEVPAGQILADPSQYSTQMVHMAREGRGTKIAEVCACTDERDHPMSPERVSSIKMTPRKATIVD